MSDQLSNAIVALGLGSVAAVLLLVPVAAWQYRLDGRLGAGDLGVLLSGAIYGMALWTYTLLPLPDPDRFGCKSARFDPRTSLEKIRYDDGLALLLRDPAFLQVALNVLLFIPLGYFVRAIGNFGRGASIAVAGVFGFGLSLLIEVTQYTGVWHLYRCAFREFDSSDLIVNTLGALGGAALAAVLVKKRATPLPLPRVVTFGRRLVAMVCDVLFVVILGGSVALAFRGLQGADGVDVGVQTWLQWGIPAAIQLASVLLVGRTIGEHVVSIRSVARDRRLSRRAIKFSVGVGPLFLVPVLPTWLSGVVLVPFIVVTIVFAWRTPGHRGLSNTLAGLDQQIATEEAFD